MKEMHSLYLLLLGIAVGLCSFVPPLVLCGEAEDNCDVYMPDDFENITVALHNFYRAHVYPSAANMKKMYWSPELARIARERACQCTYNPNGTTYPYRGSYAVENLGIHFENDMTEIVYSWFREGRNHEYSSVGCYHPPKHNYSDFSCEHYVQMVWAEACEVGCAIVNCPNLSDLYYYHFYYDPFSDKIVPYTAYSIVCVYGPGFPKYIYHNPPYITGEPCTQCSEQSSECEDSASMHYNSPPQYQRYMRYDVTGAGAGIDEGGLCFNEREACIGSDPHFAIRLSGGALLCYSFQGQPNTIFNLVSNDQLQMNALFVPDDTDYDNTWLGSIGITVRHNGKKVTTLQFTADDQLVRIGERVQLDARTIRKLNFRNGELSLVEIPPEHSPRYPHIHVNFADSRTDFVVRFTKNNHLDLYWHNTGVPFKHSSGVVGQFSHDGVIIDEDAKFLLVPGHPPVPVEEQDLWKFTKQNFHGYSKCWASAYHSSQGAGIVAGTFQDYIVEDLLSVGH